MVLVVFLGARILTVNTFPIPPSSQERSRPAEYRLQGLSFRCRPLYRWFASLARSVNATVAPVAISVGSTGHHRWRQLIAFHRWLGFRQGSVQCESIHQRPSFRARPCSTGRNCLATSASSSRSRSFGKHCRVLYASWYNAAQSERADRFDDLSSRESTFAC